MKDVTITLELISILSDGEFHSSKQLSKYLWIGQTVIDKHIQTLRDWGVDVFFISGKGYSLLDPIQLLNESIIRSHVGDGKVTVLPIINSTNQYFLDCIDELDSGDVCLAEYQQAGRGRQGRKWFSPFGTNLYFSMFWRLKQGPVATIGLSLVVGIVIAEVLQKIGANKVRVKWPNDLYLYDRKLAGILVELTVRTGDVVQVVIGAGINIVMRNVKTETINQDWITLYEAGTSINRNSLIVCLINELRNALILFEEKGLIPFLSRWERVDNLINRPVKLIIGNKEIYGISRGINAYGALMLEQNGIIRTWLNGDISLRSIE